MIKTLLAWTIKWHIPTAALNDLRLLLGIDYSRPNTLAPGRSTTEAGVQQQLRLAAPEHGVYLWRNNSGAVQDANGNFFRFGLANDSAKINKSIKSSDLIGITPVVVTQDLVGGTLGVFTSYEVKAPGWSYTGSDREKAQSRWLGLVVGAGGIGRFIQSVEEVWDD